MAKNYVLGTAARNAAADALADRLDSGKIQIYSGTRPASPATAITDQVLLAEFDFAATAFGAASAGVATAAAIADTTGESGAGAGTAATWARILTSGSVADGDCNVGTEDSPTEGDIYDIQLDNVSIASGQTVSITSFTITMPASAS